MLSSPEQALGALLVLLALTKGAAPSAAPFPTIGGGRLVLSSPEQALGALLVLVALLDVFLTVLYAFEQPGPEQRHQDVGEPLRLAEVAASRPLLRAEDVPAVEQAGR